MIMRCTCDHKGQDALHGRGMRVFNERTNNKAARCTVCGKDGKASVDTPPKKAK